MIFYRKFMKKNLYIYQEYKKTLSFYYGFVFPGTSSMAINFVALRGNSFGLQACFVVLSSFSLHWFMMKRINNRFQKLTDPYFKKY